MTETKAATPKFELTVNVPVSMDIKYVDVWPDKNGYGSQVSLKGVVDNATVISYLKGKTWANLKALQAAGVIGAYDKSVEEPTDKVALPVMAGTGVKICRRQLAGEKFATLIVEQPNGSKSPSPAKPEPPEFGGPIPGLDDDDMPPPVEDAFAETAHLSPTIDKLNALFGLYDVCFDHAVSLASQHAALNPDVSAMAATLFTQATQRGITPL